MRLALVLALAALPGTGCATAGVLGGLFEEKAPLDPARPIEVSGGLANRYSQGGQRVAEREVEQAVQVDPEARRLWRKGTTYEVAGALSWAAGTVLLLWPFGQALFADREPGKWDWSASNWNLAAGGGVAWGIGFALVAMSSAHHADAVDAYNQRFGRRAEGPRLTPVLAPAGDGLQVAVRLEW